MWGLLRLIGVIGVGAVIFKTWNDSRLESYRNIKPSWGEENGGFTYYEDLDMSIRDNDE